MNRLSSKLRVALYPNNRHETSVQVTLTVSSPSYIHKIVETKVEIVVGGWEQRKFHGDGLGV